MKKYLINDEEVTQDEFERQLEEEIEDNASDSYDDILNDCYGDINVCGYSYEASQLFKKIDEIAYRCGFSDYTSSLLSDAQYELEKGDEVQVVSMFRIEEIEDDE